MALLTAFSSGEVCPVLMFVDPGNKLFGCLVNPPITKPVPPPKTPPRAAEPATPFQTPTSAPAFSAAILADNFVVPSSIASETNSVAPVFKILLVPLAKALSAPNKPEAAPIIVGTTEA